MLQAKAKSASQSPPPASHAPNVIVPGRPGVPDIPIPVTQTDVDFLLDRRSELSAQISSATNRRNDLSRQLRSARVGPDQLGIESRISQLDTRIMQIETDLADVGKALSAAPSGLVQHSTTSSGTTFPSRPFGQPSASQTTAMGIVFMVAVLMPLSLAFARSLQRRFSHPPAPQIPKEVIDRLDRMEQGIDAVAVEVERIGEGQRFVTQLMNERSKQTALPESLPRR